MVLLTERSFDHGIGLSMVPVFDPHRFGSPSAPLNSPASPHGVPASGFAGAVGRRSKGRPAVGRNKTMTYLRASHPHLAGMVESGLPADEAFRRAVAERQSRHRRGQSHF